MASSLKVEVVKNRLPEIAGELGRALSRVVRKTAFDVEAEAKLNAPVDTGFLRSTIQAAMTGEHAAEVAVGADYGPPVEFGTTVAPAQPFLVPAVESQRDDFRKAIAQAVKQAAEG